MTTPDDDNVQEHMQQGVQYATDVINTLVAHSLGENIDRWLGAGLFASVLRQLIMMQLDLDRNLFDDAGSDGSNGRIVLMTTTVLRAMLEHPMALAALEMTMKAEEAGPRGG